MGITEIEAPQAMFSDDYVTDEMSTVKIKKAPVFKRIWRDIKARKIKPSKKMTERQRYKLGKKLTAIYLKSENCKFVLVDLKTEVDYNNYQRLHWQLIKNKFILAGVKKGKAFWCNPFRKYTADVDGEIHYYADNTPKATLRYEESKTKMCVDCPIRDDCYWVKKVKTKEK